VRDTRSHMTQAQLEAAAAEERIEEERSKARQAEKRAEKMQAHYGVGPGGSGAAGGGGVRRSGGGGMDSPRGGRGGGGEGAGVSGEELLKLLEKAWEEGKEAAEKRLAFEKEELEVQWKKVKGFKKEEANTKSIMKAIAKGRVW
jgi:hypothetical protein